MKSFLRFIGILILIVVVAVVIAGIIEPKDVSVERSIMINAPQNVVFNQIVKFKNWPHWSPWLQMDTNATLTYEGTDGQQGSLYRWNGKKLGAGSMTNAGVMNNNTLNYNLEFIKPWKSTAMGYLKAMDTAGQTKVTWTFNTHMPFPRNAMQVFMSMDKMLGSDFEKGLQNMKAYCELHASEAPVDIEEMNYAGHIYAGVRQWVNMADIGKFFHDNDTMLGHALNVHINGAYSGLYFGRDTVKHQVDMAVVFPVTDSNEHIKGISYFYAPAGKVYMAKLKGGYTSISTVHSSIMKYLTAQNKKSILTIEEYAVSPMEEKDSTKWVTNVYYLVQ